MTESFNFPVRALEALERNPAAIAFSTLTQALPNGVVAGYVRAYALHLAKRKVGRGSVVMIGLPNGMTDFFAAFATNLLGAIWIGSHEDIPLDAVKVTHLLYDRTNPVRLSHPGVHEVDDSWLTPPAGFVVDQQGLFVGFSSGDDVAYIARSSGTTGRAKFMERTVLQFCESVANSPVDGYAAIAPLAASISSMGYRNTLAGIIAGVPVVKPAPGRDFTGMAGDMARAGVEWVAGSPAQVDALCRGVEPPDVRIHMLRVAGSIMTREAVGHWLRFFQRICLNYGARERAGGGDMIVQRIEDMDEVAYTLRPEVTAQIVSDTGEVLPHSTPGIVRLRSPTMVTRYIGNNDATAEIFRDGWFYPGDLGLLMADGRLRILGRAKDQLNLGGVKFNAADVDAAVLRVPGIVGAMCYPVQMSTGMTELHLCAIAEPGAAYPQLAAAIRAVLTANRPIVRLAGIAFVDALPLNESGKPLRSAGARASDGRMSY
jgi:acyl-coenzyme A synthetase/AMP-(fatty) acid ligase